VDRAEGTRRLYQLNPEGFESLREYFEQFWTQALIAFKEKVEEQPASQEDEQRPKKVPPKETQ
jgi:DNA-binding PadR family transcriptional regulator